MKIKRVEVVKQYKFGLPNFSNVSASCGLTVEVGEDEEVDWDEIWDTVNRQLSIQADTIEPSWIISKEYRNFFKTTIKTPKGKGGEDGAKQD